MDSFLNFVLRLQKFYASFFKQVVNNFFLQTFKYCTGEKRPIIYFSRVGGFKLIISKAKSAYLLLSFLVSFLYKLLLTRTGEYA